MPHKTNEKDTLLHAFLMIHATAVSGVPLLGKKRCKRELEGYLRELCLLTIKKKRPMSRTPFVPSGAALPTGISPSYRQPLLLLHSFWHCSDQ